MFTVDAFFTPYLGHGESVRIIDPELGILEREDVNVETTDDTKIPRKVIRSRHTIRNVPSHSGK